MLVSVLVVTLSAVPFPSVGRGLEPAPDEPKVLLTTAPVSMLGLAAYSALTHANRLNSMTQLWFPLTAEIPISSWRSIHIDVGVGLGWNSWGAMGWGLSVAAGPTWYPFERGEPLTGFYLGPRVQFQIGQTTPSNAIAEEFGHGPIDFGPSIHRAFLAGFDAGYQFRVGRVVFGPVIGATMGLQFDSDQWVASPIDNDSLPQFRRAGAHATRPSGIAAAFNLNLFRLGFAL